MTTYKFERTLLRSYAVDVQQLENLSKVLKQGVGEPSFYVKLINGTVIKGQDFSVLVTLPNSGKERIIYLSISSFDFENKREASVSFSRYSDLTMELSGSEQDTLVLQKKIEGIFSYSKPSYAWFSDMPWIVCIITWFTLSVIGLPLLTSIPGIEAYPAFTASKFGYYAPAIIGSVLSQSVIEYILLKKFFFPQTQFLIGHGILRSQKLRARRTFLLIGVVAAFSISMLANWVSGRLF